MKKFAYTLFFFLLLNQAVIGQDHLSWDNKYQIEKLSENLYSEQIYQSAILLYDEILKDEEREPLIWFYQLKDYQIKRALSKLWLDNGNSEIELLSIIKGNPTITHLNMMKFELARYYFANKDYKRAIQYFEEVDGNQFDMNMFGELTFKNAYSHLVRRKFSVANQLLASIVDLESKYYYPANYYKGMTSYFTGNSDEAIRRFNIISESAAYRNYVPYYITQIYFVQKKYRQVIEHAEAGMKDPNLKYREEIKSLIGRAYFEEKKYKEAAPFLQAYIENNEKNRAEDFYQLGFTYFQIKNYELAAKYFKELVRENTKLSQNANYYLAKSFLELGKREEARIAFLRAAELDLILDLADEATINYAKLSAEMGYDRDALSALEEIDQQSILFTEAQHIIGDILENTKDYQKAIEYFDGRENLHAHLQLIYQKIAYRYAMQHLLDGNSTLAYSYFLKSETLNKSPKFTALSKFRLADIDFKQGLYQQSRVRLDTYLKSAEARMSMPMDASIGKAYYLQAYNYLNLDNNSRAQEYFRMAVDNLQQEDDKNDILVDAALRAGDTYFKDNNYQEALNFYNRAIKWRGNDVDYALFQRGIIQGLIGKYVEKVISMESLTKRFPKSSLADDALYQAGKTLLVMEKSSEAQIVYRKLMDKYKNSKLYNRSLLKLGLISFNQGDVQTAASYYRELFNHNPNAMESQEAILALEEIYIEHLSEPNTYLDFIKQIDGYEIDQFKEDSIYFRSAEVLYHNDNYSEAIAELNNYIEQYPKGFNRLKSSYYRAESLLSLSKYKQALRDYDYIISHGRSEFYTTSLVKAATIAFYETEDYSNALKYQKLLRDELDQEKEVYQNEVQIFKSLTYLDNRGDIVVQGRELLQNEYLTKQDEVFIRFSLGKIYSREDKYKEALDNFNVIIPITDNEMTAEARYLVAKIITKGDDLELAENTIRNTIRMNQSYPKWVSKSMLLLAEVFIEKEDIFQARAVLETIEENYKDDEQILVETKAKLLRVESIEKVKNRVELQDGQSFEMDTIKEK